ncbi:MAG: histidine kinase, partial [Microcoleus sp. SIO2G3]|nr:histidine kinase [Microcoleus sp. SIO2G3]
VAIAIAIAIVYAKANANTITNAIANANFIAYAYANANAIANAITNAIANANARAIANAYAYAYAIAKVGDLETLKIFKNVNFTELIARLEALKTQIPNAQQPRHMRKLFANRFMETWVKAFNLTPELVDFSEEEIKAMDNYFYANHLIIQCKEAAVRVSPKTWHSIESRMLTIRNAMSPTNNF